MINQKRRKKKKPYLPKNKSRREKQEIHALLRAAFCFCSRSMLLGNAWGKQRYISAKVSSISSGRDKVLGEATYVDATTKVSLLPTRKCIFSAPCRDKNRRDSKKTSKNYRLNKGHG